MNRENRNIVIGEDARKGILEGARKTYEAVKQAYGVTSGNVALEKIFGDPVLTHDGITIARDVFLKDPVENIGSNMIIGASKKTNDVAGDGTSATVILAYHIMEKAHKAIIAGYNPMGLRRGISKASNYIKSQIDSSSILVKDNLSSVATISAGDEAIGSLIADTIQKVGETGGVTIEEYQGLGLEQEMVEGFYFDRGFASPYMINDPARMKAFYNDCYVLVVDKKLASVNDIVPILKIMADLKEERRPLLIVGDISGDALRIVVQNHMQRNVECVSTTSPLHGDQKGNFLEDIAKTTGGRVVMEGDKLTDITLNDFGKAQKVEVGESNTTIIEGAGDKNEIKARVGLLKEQIEQEKNAFRKERMEQRLSKLEGKIAIIRVGGATELEMKEVKFRVEDAVNATKAALAEGIVPGGGVCLVDIAKKMNLVDDIESPFADDIITVNLSKDEVMGVQIVKEAIQEPFKQLMFNAGLEGNSMLRDVMKAKAGQGFDVLKGDEQIDMIKSGIIDPTKVIKLSVENACSVAGNAITTNCAIVFDDIKEEVKKYQQK